MALPRRTAEEGSKCSIDRPVAGIRPSAVEHCPGVEVPLVVALPERTAAAVGSSISSSYDIER